MKSSERHPKWILLGYSKEVPGVASQKKSRSIRTGLNRVPLESLRMILSLVKDGRYEELYEYGTDSSRASMAKEHFVKGMKGKSSVLAPSWEAIQDISAKFRISLVSTSPQK